jgi:hypothetical protein
MLRGIAARLEHCALLGLASRGHFHAVPGRLHYLTRISGVSRPICRNGERATHGAIAGESLMNNSMGPGKQGGQQTH